MKKTTLLFGALLFMLVLSSCAQKELPPPRWGYEKDAIKIGIIPDPMLNLDNGKAHTLYVCIYQLKDPNGFNQLADDPSGLYKLLNCKLFDAGVASSKRLIINPGKEQTLVMDRAENAKYIAVVAGYYSIVKERITRLVKIPVVVEKKGLISQSAKQVPGFLDITLVMGAEQIDEIREN